MLTISVSGLGLGFMWCWCRTAWSDLGFDSGLARVTSWHWRV